MKDLFVCLFVVGEEDELSIKEAAELVVEGMEFKGGLEVSLIKISPGGGGLLVSQDIQVNVCSERGLGESTGGGRREGRR